ncbi:MAG: DUF2726 domain-containing protein [Alphaproteobacteria bacterium]|nr:DUF2726 domain-containing protein [Alphaproteobacteria bacterium]MBU0804497.1 DUF2726 domain-containing protein [Alphaproteobacteria bacterium]MBU0872135.1 DUF2726 domain-containing protein [Alphaproteobacteria bacterium]MBU1403227.1 DUF2726 domain-containing protein [Alphaproteobacteria bacterium]MBU1593011.1 DUF2726 domain-containing protein [Alphaproteobacteria bacterium]
MVIQVDGSSFQLDFLLLGALAAVAFIALFLFVTQRDRKGLTAKSWRGRAFPSSVPDTSLGDSASQLRHVMSADFFKKKVMSKSEYRVFRIVESEVQAQRNGCRVLSQTSLGEVIGSNDSKAFASINSKRVDILIMGPYGEPVAAIEYQGGGHHQGSAAARDAIKREALRKAGVHFLEVAEGHTAEEIGMMVKKLFPQPASRGGPFEVRVAG